MMARVYLSLIRFPTPYPPPLQPVLTSHALTLFSRIFSASISAYLVGCHTRNGAPKHAEKTGLGSVTPISVPATFAVRSEERRVGKEGVRRGVTAVDAKRNRDASI